MTELVEYKLVRPYPTRIKITVHMGMIKKTKIGVTADIDELKRNLVPSSRFFWYSVMADADGINLWQPFSPSIKLRTSPITDKLMFKLPSIKALKFSCLKYPSTKQIK